MTKEHTQRLRQLLRILLSLSILLAGVCLIAACLSIYYSGGDQPYSRESVAAAFGSISIPVYLCLGLMVLSFAAELLPSPAAKPAPIRQTGLILQRLQARTDLSLCDDALQSGVLAQRRTRRLHRRISWILLFVCSVIFLSYGMNPHNFHQSQINDSMIQAMYLFVPCTLIPFGYGIFTAYHSRRSMETEISLLKSAPPESKIAAEKQETVPFSHRTVLRNILLAVAIVILVYGYFAGGTADVLTKAVNICTECVGLG